MIDAACLEDSMEARKEIATINSRNDIVVWYVSKQILSFFEDGFGTDDIIIFGRTLIFLKCNGSTRAVKGWRDGVLTFESFFKGSIYK